jgi:hypothetical protein
VARAQAVKINRAPVLTLWAAVVAERLGFDWDEALTLGRVVAGLNAYAKGKALGIYKPHPKTLDEERRKKEAAPLRVELLHRAVPVTRTAEGLRAVSKDRPLAPDSVQRYLASKFGEALDDTVGAMRALADSLEPDVLAERAYALYEDFRPEVPAGTRGWGAAGVLDLKKIRGLARTSRTAVPK